VPDAALVPAVLPGDGLPDGVVPDDAPADEAPPDAPPGDWLPCWPAPAQPLINAAAVATTARATGAPRLLLLSPMAITPTSRAGAIAWKPPRR